MDDQEAINQLEWERPENWTGWLRTYRSARDTRIWVPKQWGVGMTPNLAHKQGRLFLACLFIVPGALFLTLLLVALLR